MKFILCVTDALIQLTHDVQPLGVEVIGISSNSALTHPQDGPEKMAEDVRSFGTPNQLQLCALGLCRSVKAPMPRDTHLHGKMQGILSNICMMSLKKQLRLTKLLALQSCI